MLLTPCCPARACMGSLESRSSLDWRTKWVQGTAFTGEVPPALGEVCVMRLEGLACTSLCLSGLPQLAAHSTAYQSLQLGQALTVCEASPGLAALAGACRGFVSSSSSLEVTAATVCALACWNLEVSASWAAFGSAATLHEWGQFGCEARRQPKQAL